MARATGLDIGHRSVRAVVLERVGRELRLAAHGEVSRLDANGEPKPLAAAVAELDAIVQFRGNVVTAVNDISALVRFVSTLPLPPDRLARLLRLELSQHADAGGDLAADTMVVPVPSDELMHLCVLTQPAQVYSALVDLRDAGLRSAQVHFGPAAAYNATLPLPPVQDSALALLVDIGSDTTGVTLFGDDRMLACRQVPFGGQAFTEALVASGRDRGAAEAAKRERAAPSATGLSSDDPFARSLDSALTLDDHEDEGVVAPASPGELPAATSAAVDGAHHDDEVFVIEDHPESAASPGPTAPLAGAAPAAAARTPTPPPSSASARAALVPAAGDGLDTALHRPAEALFGQIVSSVTWFKSQLRLKHIELKLVCLAGGGAALPGLAAYLERRLSAPVRLYDPFAGLAEGPRPERVHEWTGAVGLALADRKLAQRGAIRFDLRPDSLIRKELWRERLVWPFVAAACLALAAVLSLMALGSRYSAQEQSLANYDAYKSERAAQLKRLSDLEAHKAALSDDLRAVASRIYAGRDVLYTIRALKERTEASPQLWVTRLETLQVGADASLTKEQIERGDLGGEVKPGDVRTIERGAVAISGRVRFDDENGQRDEVQRDLVEKWKKFVFEWSPDASSPLFSKAEEKDFGRTPGGKGREWMWVFYFAPTDLTQLTFARPVDGGERAP